MARPPNYRLRVLDKTTDKKGELGAAWSNADGSISIIVNPGCRLEYNPDFVYTLFVNDEKWQPKKEPQTSAKSKPTRTNAPATAEEGNNPF